MRSQAAQTEERHSARAARLLTKPSWYLVATNDRMIPPPAQHAMAEKVGATLSEVAAGHPVYLSQPEAVATLIAQAAAGAAER